MIIKKFKKAFTLIELLVVIAIIAGLSTLFIPNFMTARERARDSQRKSDLRQIQKAFEMYKQDQTPHAFPATLPSNNACWSSGSGCTGNIYMNKFPSDPNRTPNNYYYSVNNTNLTYTLCACLENKADSEGTDSNCAVDYICSSGKSYIVNQP